MATAYHNLSAYDITSVPDASAMKFGIVVSEWNENITAALLHGAKETLLRHGAKPENIIVHTVPGSFELSYLSQVKQQEFLHKPLWVYQGSDYRRKSHYR